MKFSEYEQTIQDASSVFKQMDKSTAAYYTVLGLIDEAGEVAGKLKKVMRGDRKMDADFYEDMKGELGDVLWYLSMAANTYGFSMDEIAQSNIDKVLSREARGVVHGDGDHR